MKKQKRGEMLGIRRTRYTTCGHFSTERGQKCTDHIIAPIHNRRNRRERFTPRKTTLKCRIDPYPGKNKVGITIEALSFHKRWNECQGTAPIAAIINDSPLKPYLR